MRPSQARSAVTGVSVAWGDFRRPSPIGENGKPIAESLLRPLSGLEPEQQKAAWEESTKATDNPTAGCSTLGILRNVSAAFKSTNRRSGIACSTHHAAGTPEFLAIVAPSPRRARILGLIDAS
jgi:hypothetical protein